MILNGQQALNILNVYGEVVNGLGKRYLKVIGSDIINAWAGDKKSFVSPDYFIKTRSTFSIIDRPKRMTHKDLIAVSEEVAPIKLECALRDHKEMVDIAEYLMNDVDFLRYLNRAKSAVDKRDIRVYDTILRFHYETMDDFIEKATHTLRESK